MNRKLKYIKPKPYHEIIRDISSIIDKMVKDPRSTDRTFFEDEIKQTLEVLNYELLRSDDEINNEMVYVIGLRLISNLILQSTLFGRICISNKQKVNGEIEDLITLPRSSVPFFMKQTLQKGKNKDYYDNHSLKQMKKHYDKELLSKSVEEIINGR
jgi:hypothetical protein